MDHDEIDRIKKEAVEKTRFENRVDSIDNRVKRLERVGFGILAWAIAQISDKIGPLWALITGGK